MAVRAGPVYDTYRSVSSRSGRLQVRRPTTRSQRPPDLPRCDESGGPRIRGRGHHWDKPQVTSVDCVKIPGVMTRLLQQEEATAALFHDGWLVDRRPRLLARRVPQSLGRLKDVMILAGQNVVPEDIEEIGEHNPGVARYVVAVGIESYRSGRERLLVVAEVRDDDGAVRTYSRIHRAADRSTVCTRAATARRESRLPGTMPKTSSGKLQRAKCELYLAGKAELVPAISTSS